LDLWCSLWLWVVRARALHGRIRKNQAARVK
jgi:hypothetical protein